MTENKPKFEDVFNLQTEMNYGLVGDNADIETLTVEYENAKDNHFKDWANIPMFNTLEAIDVWHWMSVAHRYSQRAEWKITNGECKTSGTEIKTENGNFHSAINSKIYREEDYRHAIRQWNLINGVVIDYLDSDGHLCASDIDQACKDLKTYSTEEVFGDFRLGKLKFGGYRNFVVVEEDEEC